MHRAGLLFVISAPSGTGKTSVIQRLRSKDPAIVVAISATTRQARASEVPGESYHFMSEAAFVASIESHHFIEHAHIFSHRYGTLRAPLDMATAHGTDTLLALDWSGVRALRDVYGSRVVAIFLLPPSLTELGQRLHGRGQDRPDHIAYRLRCAKEELQEAVHYDYWVTNHCLDNATDLVWAIIQSERCRLRHLHHPETLLAGVMDI
jgi:guanylate kinase